MPVWDYSWQFDSLYSKGVRCAPSDLVLVECRFSNTADRQPIVNGKRLPVRTLP